MLHAIVPFLVLGVALLQMYRSKLEDLSPWKGGGFGMFSTIDAPSSRVVKIWIEYQGHEYPVELTPGLNKERIEAATYPTTERLDRFLKKLHSYSWYLQEKQQLGGNTLNIPPSNQRLIAKPFKREPHSFSRRISKPKVVLSFGKLRFERDSARVLLIPTPPVDRNF